MSSSTILLKKKNAQNYLLLDKEKQIEDSAIDCDVEYHGRLRKIYKEWAKNLKEQHAADLYKRPLCTVSSYIKARLRSRGASEWAINNVSRCLDQEFKLEKYDTSHSLDNGQDDMSISLAIGHSNERLITSDIFLDFAKTAQRIKNNVDWFALMQESITLCQGVMTKKAEELIEIRKRAKKELANIKDIATTYNLAVFPETKGVDLPPEHFRGKSQAYDYLKRLAASVHMLGNHIDGAAEKIKIYKPDKKTDEKMITMLEGFVENKLNVMASLCQYMIDGVDHIFESIDNQKICASQEQWYKMGWDDLKNTGTRGSGVVNAIKTGQRLISLSKDGKSVITVDVKRPFTKEDVGEQTGAKLLKRAFDTCMNDELCQAFRTWSNHTQRKIKIMEIEDYYRKKMNIPNDVNIEVVTKKVPYLPIDENTKPETTME